MTDHLVNVRLLDVPVAVHQQAAEHRDALDREFALAVADDPSSLPWRLRSVNEQMRNSFQTVSEVFTTRMNEAIERGEDRFTIDLQLPPEAADALERFSGLMAEADAAAEQGNLLTLKASPLTVAYRRWLVREIIQQIREGRPPKPWREGTEADPESDSNQAPEGTDHTLVVREDLDFTTAAKLRGELADLIDSGVGEVVIDLSGCEFVDSVGVGLLVSTHKRCEAEGGRLRLKRMSENVERALDLAGLLEVLHVG